VREPLVSILIPAYNAAQWIDSAIQSAAAQTWSRKEIIVVDDGSSDETASIVKARGSGVKLVRQENRGAASARNSALAVAQGDYIQWLDADDLLGKDKIATQLKAADGASSRTLFSSSFGSFYIHPDRAFYVPTGLWRDLSPVEWLIEKFSTNTWMNPAVWLVSRDLTEAAGPWNPIISLDDDGEYFSRIIAASDFVRFVPEARCYYRQWNPWSLSRSTGDKAARSLLTSARICIDCLLKLEDSERTRAAARALLQTRIRYFHPEHPRFVEVLQSLAKDFGGEVRLPQLRSKYVPIRGLFGWSTAKKVARWTAATKLAASITLDRMRGLPK